MSTRTSSALQQILLTLEGSFKMRLKIITTLISSLALCLFFAFNFGIKFKASEYEVMGIPLMLALFFSLVAVATWMMAIKKKIYIFGCGSLEKRNRQISPLVARLRLVWRVGLTVAVILTSCLLAYRLDAHSVKSMGWAGVMVVATLPFIRK